MKAVYVDSSILVALLLKEGPYRHYESVLEQYQSLFSSHLLEAEVYAVSCREKVDRQLAEEFVEKISLIFPDRSLKEEYRRIFEVDYCRGADACHIATALYLDPETRHLLFLTADKRQGKIAKGLGYSTL